MKKTNIINKSTQKWIKSQPCYYDDKYYIAEGYCDRQAALIYEGKYICRKCATLKKQHKISNIFRFISLIVVTIGIIFIGCYYSPRFWWSLLFGLVSACLLVGLGLDIVNNFSFEHKGELVEDWDGFCCYHCSKNFLSKDTKPFTSHLKSEHSEEWKEIEKKIQQFPNDKKIIKIEFPEILKEHKKEISWQE